MTAPHVTLGSILRWLGISLAVGLFIGYVLWQSRIFITGPAITITTNPPATTTEATTNIGGTAENIVWIRINGRDIVTTPEGEFKETITLPTGYTIVELTAADRFGRIKALQFPIVRQAASSTEPLTQ